MRKAIIAITLGIFILSFATAIYSGECSEIDLVDLENTNNLVYTVVGNSSNMDGMSVTTNGTIAEVCFDELYESDSFTLVFANQLTNEVITEVIVHSGGGGGSTKYIDRNVTEYVEVERTVYVDDFLDCEEELPIEEEEKEKVSFFKKIWNWIKNIFKKGDK